MSITKEDIKKIRDMGQLGSLCHFITASMKETKKTADNQLREKIKSFEDNATLLVTLVFNNGIPSAHLSRYLILIINKIILTENSDNLATVGITGIKKNVEQIVNSMSILHQLCQEEVFRVALCHIQDLFSVDCTMNTEAPRNRLREQLQALQLSSPNDKSTVYTKNTQQIQGIQFQIEKIEKEIKEAEAFCEKYKVTPEAAKGSKAKGSKAP